MTAKQILSQTAREIGAGLDSQGYRRTGSLFVRRGEEVISLIELQPARGATAQELSFAVNFGVLAISLLDGEEPAKPTYTDCHWGGRLCGADGVEQWWTVRDTDLPSQRAQELLAVLNRDVLPVLHGMQTERALIELWQTRRSPLLVEAQRLLYLGRLLHRAGRYDEFAAVRSELEDKAREGFALRALQRLRDLRC